MTDAPTIAWYIVKQKDGHCEIVPETEIATTEQQDQWGPFTSEGEAIARRVGLIRAGKCRPV